MTGIYKIESPSGKIYIGKSVKLEKRKYQYSIGNCEAQKTLFASIEHYGFNNHIFEVVAELPDDISKKDLSKQENAFWYFYKEAGFEMMNMQEPNGTGKNKAYKPSERSEEFEFKKSVSQYSIEGKLIANWKTIKQCAKILNIDPKLILESTRKKKFSVNEFFFREGKGLNDIIIPTFKKKILESDEIFEKINLLQFDSNHNLIRCWTNSKAAATSLKIDDQLIEYHTLKQDVMYEDCFWKKIKNNLYKKIIQ